MSIRIPTSPNRRLAAGLLTVAVLSVTLGACAPLVVGGAAVGRHAAFYQAAFGVAAVFGAGGGGDDGVHGGVLWAGVCSGVLVKYNTKPIPPWARSHPTEDLVEGGVARCGIKDLDRPKGRLVAMTDDRGPAGSRTGPDRPGPTGSAPARPRTR